MENKRKTIKKLKGVVVSDKMDKTIVIKVDRLAEHPRYKKRVRISKKFKAHDEKNEARIGDFVEISQSRPISKDKKWKLESIIKKVETGEELDLPNKNLSVDVSVDADVDEKDKKKEGDDLENNEMAPSDETTDEK